VELLIITRTPLRISFTGGGTDIKDYYQIHGGAVVSATINKYIYITVNKKFDQSIRVSYSRTEIVPEVRELQHELVRECLRMVGITGGVEITSIADIPSGTGLGSSSSFVIGVLNALYAYAGSRLSAHELAEKACEIEISILKHPIGKQDQFAVAYGGLNFFEFGPDDSVRCSQINLSEEHLHRMERKLIMLYTGTTRSADGVLQEQKNNTLSKLDVLDYMRDQAYGMRAALETEGFTEAFALALHQGWEKKRTLASTIANREIDRLYDKALEAGAIGGKVLGAGGGGFFLFYCDEDKQKRVKDALGLEQTYFSFDYYGSRVVYFA
jgi:D-glycero-alpha-D-manno-heptose-7-phosphate kinase